MKTTLLSLVFALASLPALAAPLLACGSHALEQKYRNLSWSKVSQISVSTFAGGVTLNICVGVDRQYSAIKRFTIRDANGRIQRDEALSSFAKFNSLMNQAYLPSVVSSLVRPGDLITLRVTGAAPRYSGEIRFHRMLGPSKPADIRVMPFQVTINGAGEADAAHAGQAFDKLKMGVQTIMGPLSITEFTVTNSVLRSERDIPTENLTRVGSLF